ncbi:MAG: hypothetical protein H6737_07410 [Alphaproteobacteria bacterium]|nr:hypothetical protein [Alphaproteobacteria bacterium]
MFDYFIALDGNGLNGFEGHAGVARLRADPDADRYDVDVRFFDGLAGGHATQINAEGTVGFLGNLSQSLLFYDPRTLEEIRRFSTLRFVSPEVLYQSQTHVVWVGERDFIAVLGPDFYRFRLDDLEHPERLGPHRVTLPHALKRSPSGRYLFYGAMDHDRHGYANQAGIFDLETGEARVVELPATVWHLGVHPTRDVFYAPSQRCLPQGGEFGEYVIPYFKNYLFEIDGPSATVLRHAAIAKELPGFLTSDVVVTDTEVLYNVCASGMVARIDLETLSKVAWIDERSGPLGELLHLRTGLCNLAESLARANLPDAVHLFVKSLRITGGRLLDGSYGLQRSPCGRYVLSAHRGRNEVIVYRYPSFEVVKRVRFPSIRRFFPAHVGRLGDPRLGFHHTALSTATC